MLLTTVLPRSSAPTALINETLCPNLLRWAEKLNEAPPRYSSWPTMSQSTSPILMTFTRTPRNPCPASGAACTRQLEILAQYTLPCCRHRRASVGCEGLREGH